MKLSKKLLATSFIALTVASVAPSVSAQPEVSGSVGVANMYYWRGIDLGNGDAAVSGDLNVSMGGAYGGIWGSSGDSAAGTEYDLYAGYGQSFGAISVDISAWTYVYPSATATEVVGTPESGYSLATLEAASDPGDLSEVILSVGAGPVSVTYYDNIAGASGYWYYTVGASAGDFSFTYGQHEDDFSHFDVGYAYNDNLSFTIGIPVDDVDGAYDDDPKFVVSYSLPIE